uniref:BZIP transcription factor hapX (Iron acquisition regulator hapX) n=1 Tax=Ganoderma boninense TaxID=34458 RepID=A0A5K1K7E8_9APHY|nr:bZIP transcription factor hapX (Iron acquisition regulator hapX) [Ganoderma boninense]
MKESYIFQIWPESDKSIVDILPYVSGLFRSSKTTRFFWKEDVIKVGALLEGIIEEVGRGTLGAAGGLQLFRYERMALVASILEVRVVPTCTPRSAGMHSKESMGPVLIAVLRLFDRFTFLGYDEQAIKDVLKDVPTRTALLTDQAWDDIRTRYEPRLLHQLFLNRRDSDVAAEPPHLKARREVITEIYDEHCKTLSPIEREYIPPVQIVSMFPPFANILKRPANVEVPREDFTRAMANIDPYICAWDSVVDMRMGATAGWQTTGHDGDANKINLAGFVTLCSHPSHRTVPTGPVLEGCAPFETLQFSETGSAAVRELIRLAGLREEKAMPLHMDFTRARFVCEHCDAEPREGEEGLFKPVMDWRQAANHYIDCWRQCRTDHLQPGWRMLTDVENEAVMKAEHDLEDLPEHRDDPRTWFWRCNLCNTFEPRSFVAAFLHVKQRHFVFQPKVGVGRELYPDGLGVRAHEPAHHIRVDCALRIIILTVWNGVRKLLEPDLAALQEKADKHNADIFRSRRQEIGERCPARASSTASRTSAPSPNAPRNKIGSDDYAVAIDKLPDAIAAWSADVDKSLRKLGTKDAPPAMMRLLLGIMHTLDAAMFVTECTHAAHDDEKANCWGDIAFGKGETLAHLVDHLGRGGPADSWTPSNTAHSIPLCSRGEQLTVPMYCRVLTSVFPQAIHVIDRLRMGKNDHLEPSWRLLTDRELRALKLAEEKCKLESTYPLWVRCNKCLDERFETKTEKAMMEHLQSVHDISKPVLGEDFYYNPLKAGSLTPVHRICVEPAPDDAVRIRSIGQVGTILSYSELDYRGV